VRLVTPEKIQELRRKLYHKAEQEKEYRFYTLYDKVYRKDILEFAYRLCRSNGGAPGVDGQTFSDIEEHGVEGWLHELAEEVRTEQYCPSPVRRVMIPKPDGVSERPLGIPTIRDRVVQTAANLILEPVFEADFDEAAYGYRPGRSALQAVQKVHKSLIEGHTQVLDADISGFFDNIPHAELMKCVARRVSDGRMLHLIKMWLKSPIEETDEKGRKRYAGGKKSKRGTPQGGVISPLLANIYMHRYIKAFKRHGLDRKYGAVLVSYADDFVVLCRRGAEEVLEITKQWMEQIGLELNLDKTAVRNARDEHFDFLGYTFGPVYYEPTGAMYLGAMPSKKAGKRLRRHVREVLRPGNMDPWEEVAAKLNRRLAGWANYFSYGTLAKTRRGVDFYVQDRVRHFLRRRMKIDGRGTAKMSEEMVFGKLEVLSVRKSPRKSYAHAL
jgi:RNA-directed DNA polymerase